jgi:GRF zinc finger
MHRALLQALDSLNQENGAVGLCKCELTPVLRTVIKDGPNCGRKFWSCPSGPKGRCSFLQWDDQVSQEGGLGLNSPSVGACFKVAKSLWY